MKIDSIDNKEARSIGTAGMVALSVFLIFVIAFVVRLVYIYQLSGTYFFAPFKGGFDDYIFDNWAREILNGNWLGDSVIYIYRMPLYVYFLSYLYFIFGHSYWAVYLIQVIMGSLACVAVYYIAKLYFDNKTGLVAGLINALYGPLLFYTGMVVGETLGLLITLTGFLFLLLFQKSQKFHQIFFAGLFMGLAMLLRGNILLITPLIIGWILISFRQSNVRRLIIYTGLFIIGIILAISPIMIRNFIFERDVVPISALGGLNAYIGNAYGADGKYRMIEGIGTNPEDMITNSIRIAERDAGHSLKPSQVSNYWIGRTLRSMQDYKFFYLPELLWKKFVMCWSAYELPDIWDYYFFKRYIPILNFPFFTFMLLTPLSFAGIYLAWVRRRELSLLYLFVIGYILSLVAFFITSRYRIQLVPFLSIFAAYGILEFIKCLKGDKKRAVIVCIICILGLVVANLYTERISFETSYNSLGILLKRDGRMDEAIKTYKKAIDMAPNYPSPYYNLGILYRDRGDYQMARKYFMKTLEVAPDHMPAKRELGIK